jgi:nicotinamide mononucleotide (NMN) deamidase PncC
MARAAVSSSACASVGVGITGSLSRKDPDNPHSEPGVVYIAVMFGKKITSKEFRIGFEGERPELKEAVIAKAFEMVLKVLA